MDTIFQDLRYTLRQLTNSPGFTLTAMITLVLGIGANAAVFCVLNATLLNPSGIPHPEQIVAIRTKYQMGDLKDIAISTPDFVDAVQAKNIFTFAAVTVAKSFNYATGGTTAERLNGAAVSWQWFDVFWTRPYLGRVFHPEEDQPGANHEVVLSYSTWKQRFGTFETNHDSTEKHRTQL